VALGDVNGDGDLDAVFASHIGENRLRLGNGDGSFFCGDLSDDTNRAWGVALGDLDGDGDLDAVFANFGDFVSDETERNRVCVGNGAGGFTCSDVSQDSGHATAVALGDVDGDGDLDAVFAYFGGDNRACLGDGSGGFANCAPSLPSGGYLYTMDVALGDVDGDGDLDAVFANEGDPFAFPAEGALNPVCFGDGSGEFTCYDAYSEDTSTTLGVAIATPLCQGQVPTIPSTNGPDIIHGTDGADVIWGWGGGDTIYGGDGDDLICLDKGADNAFGGRGADRIFGGPGADTISGGAGKDVIKGGGGADTLDGGKKRDKIFGNGGSDSLFGRGGDDTLEGGGKGDLLEGGKGDDELFGGKGADTLKGGGGDDLADGGGGTDTCVAETKVHCEV